MLDEVDHILMPSQELRQELDAVLAERPELWELCRPQPGEPEEPTLTWVGGAQGEPGAYPLVAMPVPERPGTLWVSRMPGRAGEEHLAQELEAIAAAGIRQVVCLVPEVHVSNLYELPGYAAAARQAFGDGFRFVEVMDYEPPANDAAFEAAVAEIDEQLKQGESVLIHCGAGCGRTGTLASCLLVRAGMDAAEAIRTYRRRRACGPESHHQVAYVVRYARRYRRQLGS